MKEALQVIFGLFGGLAVFVFGMNMMSECLQKAAGEKMRTVLSLLTKNPVLGVLAGALTTAVLQSSSATTVMAIGFVSAGLMSLPQAISIIFGANIGTTITAQVIAFKLSDYIYAIIFIGFMVSFVCQSQKIKNIGQTIFAFGILFLGIETMGSVMKPLASSLFFTGLIGKVADIPILGVAVGTIMTLVVQSSSATIAVLQNFASQAGPDGVTSIIGLTGAIPILLGDNIGTTITALLASIGQSKDAKRTALAHCIFNISGAFLFIWFVKPYAYVIQMISTKGEEIDVISRQIANAHTGFNLAMTLIWIPLLGVMVKLVALLIPEGQKRNQIIPSAPKYLDTKLLGQPVAALRLVAKEVVRCSELVKEMLTEMKEYSEEGEGSLVEHIVEKADIEERLSDSINDYLASMFSEGVLTEEQAAQSAGIMYVLCDIDRISSLCKEITENIANKNNGQQRYSMEALQDLRKSVGVILEMYLEATHAILNGDDISIRTVQEKKTEVMQLDEKMRRAHMERVGKKKCDASLTGAFNNVLHNIDRMGNSCVNLVDTAIRQVDFRIFLDDNLEMAQI